MRPAPILLASLALCALPARADGRNDQVRREARRQGPPQRDGSDHSGTGSACDVVSCLCDLLGAMAEAEPPITMVEGRPPEEAQVAENGPYEVPPAVEEPVRGLALLGMGRPLAHELIVVPRAEVFVDLPIDRTAFRFGLEQELFLELVPASAARRAHWDDLPLSTMRFGWIFRPGAWELGPIAGVRMLWLTDGHVAGVDAGFRVTYEAPAWFFDASVTAMVLGSGGLVGTEPAVRIGVRTGPAQLGIGWRHLQFRGDEVIPYTGPEASVALRF